MTPPLGQVPQPRPPGALVADSLVRDFNLRCCQRLDARSLTVAGPRQRPRQFRLVTAYIRQTQGRPGHVPRPPVVTTLVFKVGICAPSSTCRHDERPLNRIQFHKADTSRRTGPTGAPLKALMPLAQSWGPYRAMPRTGPATFGQDVGRRAGRSWSRGPVRMASRLTVS